MPESDDMTEEDMLVDSDDEHQAERVPDPHVSFRKKERKNLVRG